MLQGSAGLQGFGNNSLSNAIYGTSADNQPLDGDAGADFMYGGAGNDTYFIDNIAGRLPSRTPTRATTRSIRRSTSRLVVETLKTSSC